VLAVVHDLGPGIGVEQVRDHLPRQLAAGLGQEELADAVLVGEQHVHVEPDDPAGGVGILERHVDGPLALAPHGRLDEVGHARDLPASPVVGGDREAHGVVPRGRTQRRVDAHARLAERRAEALADVRRQREDVEVVEQRGDPAPRAALRGAGDPLGELARGLSVGGPVRHRRKATGG